MDTCASLMLILKKLNNAKLPQSQNMSFCLHFVHKREHILCYRTVLALYAQYAKIQILIIKYNKSHTCKPFINHNNFHIISIILNIILNLG